jgi:16S rRNA processing protein RimM
VICGRVGRPHGLDGTVVVRSESDDPTRFSRGAVFFLADGTTRTVRSVRMADRELLVRFEGVEDRTSAEALQGESLMIEPSARRALGPDEYWPDELVGLEVESMATGERLGRVVGYVEGVGQDRLRILWEGEAVEVPFVRALVPEVDVEAGVVCIDLIEGIIPPRSEER